MSSIQLLTMTNECKPIAEAVYGTQRNVHLFLSYKTPLSRLYFFCPATYSCSRSCTQIDTDSYVESNEWRLLAVPAKRNVVQYPCCAEPYLDLSFFIVIQRIPIFHMIILIVPCVLLTLLTLVSFWLPPETPAKILLGRRSRTPFCVDIS